MDDCNTGGSGSDISTSDISSNSSDNATATLSSTLTLELPMPTATPVTTAAATATSVQPNIHPSASNNYDIMEHYTIGNLLSEGQYGKVYSGKRKTDQYCVAVKIINDKQTVKLENYILKHVSHMNIVKYVESVHNISFYIVTELIDGPSLLKLATHRPLPEHEARGYALQLVSAVEFLHNKGIIHRDIKLENIMLRQHWTPVLIDFGFACFWHETYLITSFCGSPEYSAPEIITFTPYRGPEVDVWSLNVVIYALTHNYFPFHGKTLEKLMRNILVAKPKFKPHISPSLRNLLATVFMFDNVRRDISYIKNSMWLRGFHDITPVERLELGINISKSATVQHIPRRRYIDQHPIVSDDELAAAATDVASAATIETDNGGGTTANHETTIDNNNNKATNKLRKSSLFGKFFSKFKSHTPRH